jgi:sugar-specific transcriptional regulator TrmB
MEKEIMEMGFNQNEAKIYLELIKHKSITASNLAKLTGVHRATIYLELDNLIKKGLVSYVIKDFKRYYQAASPEKLIEIMDSRAILIKNLLPKLKETYKTEELFKIDVFEGKEGLKTFYQDILNSKPREILAFGVTGRAFEILEFAFPHFVKKYEKAGIKARYLANLNSKKLLNGLPKSKVKIRYLSEEYFSDVTTIIYSDKVSIQSLIKDNIYVILIKDRNLAKGYKNYFEFMWKVAK